MTVNQFAGDAERHRRDAPRFCPSCAQPMAVEGRGIATEYWAAEDRVFVCWCGACGWRGDIVLSDQIVVFEPEH